MPLTKAANDCNVLILILFVKSSPELFGFLPGLTQDRLAFLTQSQGKWKLRSEVFRGWFWSSEANLGTILGSCRSLAPERYFQNTGAISKHFILVIWFYNDLFIIFKTSNSSLGKSYECQCLRVARKLPGNCRWWSSLIFSQLWGAARGQIAVETWKRSSSTVSFLP